MAPARWLVWTGAAHEDDTGRLQAAQFHKGQNHGWTGKVLLQGLWAEVQFSSQRNLKVCSGMQCIQHSLSCWQTTVRPAAGRGLQWLGALLLCAEPFVMLCQVLQVVLLQQVCQAVPCCFLSGLPWAVLLQQLKTGRLCVPPHLLQDVLLRRLKAEVMGELPPKRRQVGPRALCSVLPNITPDM